MQDFTVVITGYDAEAYSDANMDALEGQIIGILGPVVVQDVFRAQGMESTMRVTLRCPLASAKAVLKEIKDCAKAAREGHPIKKGEKMITIVPPDDAEEVYKKVHGKEVREAGGGGGGKAQEQVLTRLESLEGKLEQEQSAAHAERVAAEQMRVDLQKQAQMAFVKANEEIEARKAAEAQREHLNKQLVALTTAETLRKEHDKTAQAQLDELTAAAHKQMVGQATFQKELFEGLNGAFELLSGKVMTQIQTLQMTPAQGATAETHGNPKMLTPPRSKGGSSKDAFTPDGNVEECPDEEVDSDGDVVYDEDGEAAASVADKDYEGQKDLDHKEIYKRNNAKYGKGWDGGEPFDITGMVTEAEERLAAQKAYQYRMWEESNKCNAVNLEPTYLPRRRLSVRFMFLLPFALLGLAGATSIEGPASAADSAAGRYGYDMNSRSGSPAVSVGSVWGAETVAYKAGGERFFKNSNGDARSKSPNKITSNDQTAHNIIHITTHEKFYSRAKLCYVMLLNSVNSQSLKSVQGGAGHMHGLCIGWLRDGDATPRAALQQVRAHGDGLHGGGAGGGLAGAQESARAKVGSTAVRGVARAGAMPWQTVAATCSDAADAGMVSHRAEDALARAGEGGARGAHEWDGTNSSCVCWLETAGYTASIVRRDGGAELRQAWQG